MYRCLKIKAKDEHYPKRLFEEKIKRKFENLSNILASQAGGTCTLVLHSPSVAP
jgi:hypothetical protein